MGREALCSTFFLAGSLSLLPCIVCMFVLFKGGGACQEGHDVLAVSQFMSKPLCRRIVVSPIYFFIVLPQCALWRVRGTHAQSVPVQVCLELLCTRKV